MPTPSLLLRSLRSFSNLRIWDPAASPQNSIDQFSVCFREAERIYSISGIPVPLCFLSSKKKQNATLSKHLGGGKPAVNHLSERVLKPAPAAALSQQHQLPPVKCLSMAMSCTTSPAGQKSKDPLPVPLPWRARISPSQPSPSLLTAITMF